jgi:peptidoglycan/LPS O-acetylase OafA/YrhL
MPQLEHSLFLALGYVLAVYAAAISFAALLARVGPVDARLAPSTDRYGGLDGLRGLLAVGVFVHHTFAEYVYRTTGRWSWSESPLFNHLGQTGVALFFMVTAFLFSSRLLAGNVSWRAIYLSRVARIVPLYLVFVAVVAVSAFHFSGWTLREPPTQILREIGSWTAFSFWGTPDINGLPMTWTISAGVNWSLTFEWLFYVSMPLLALGLARITGEKAARLALGVFFASMVVVALTGKGSGWKLYVMHFASGTAVALLYRDAVLRAVLASRAIKIAGMAGLAALLAFQGAAGGAQVLLTTLFFASVVSSPGWLLQRRGVRWLGEISYGVYLLHGVVLFWVLSYFRADLAGMRPVAYALIASAVVAVVTALASVLHFAVELPGIRWGKACAERAGLKTHVPAGAARTPC